MTADDKYSLRNSENLQQTLLPKKQKKNSDFCAVFLKSTSNFEHVGKKMTLITYLFPKLQTAKGVVRKMSKKPISEYRSTGNMLKVPKHKWNLHGTTFIIFSHYFEQIRVGKCLSWWYLKSYHCLLRYRMPITSTVAVLGRIYSNRFKCTYLRNWKVILSFLVYFWNFHETLNILKKKMTLITSVFLKLNAAKDVVK